MSSDNNTQWTVHQCRPDEKTRVTTVHGWFGDDGDYRDRLSPRLYESAEPPEQYYQSQFATGLLAFVRPEMKEMTDQPNLDWLDLAERHYPALKHPEDDLFHRVDAMVVSSRRQIIDSWTKK